VNKIGAINVKGCYGDGDKGLIKALNHLLPYAPFQLCVFHKELRMGQVVPVKSVRFSRQLTAFQKHDIKVFQLLFREVIYTASKDDSVHTLEQLKKYCDKIQDERFIKAYRSLSYNFKYTLTHFDHPHMDRDNNIIEGFNSIIKRRLKLLKGFKKTW
jgi:transposase-like protein